MPTKEEDPDSYDPAVKTAMEEYVAGLAADCPAFPPDDRQKYFFSCLDELRKEMPDGEFISMSGFKASAPDLGWLMDRVDRIVDEKFVEKGCLYVSALIDILVSRSVQRVKWNNVVHLSEISALEVRFTTQDDEGHYDYHFRIPLPPDEDEEESSSERDPE